MIVFFGTITSTHGIKGEVNISFPNRAYINNLSLPYIGSTIFIGDDKKPYRLLSIKHKNKALVFGIESVTSIDEASKLKGQGVYLDLNSLPQLDDNTFYENELIGFDVIYKDDGVIGEVYNVYSLPANDVIEIKLENGEIIGVPFVHKYFGDVSREDKEIILLDKDILLNGY